MTILDITNGLVESTISGTSKTFIPFLLSPIVKTKMPNKIRFYSFYKYMLTCAKNNSTRPWILKIEKTTWTNEENAFAYNFYDTKYKYPRLSIVLFEKNNFLHLDTLPF